MKKDVIIYSLIFVLSFVTLVSAGCDDSQTMFRLYQNTNSHVALWNQTVYSIPFCYNDTFGTYSGVNPHICTETNTLFYLTADSNSHVSNSSANGYSTPVCYGDLNCIVSTSVCTGEYKNISRLYNYTNSHISNLSDVNYPYYLCCKNSGASFSTDLKWLDLKGGDLLTANVNDEVAIYFGQNNVNFTIINESSKVAIYTGSTSEKYYIWIAVAGKYSFNITTSLGDSYRSSNITISGSEDSSPSESNIILPGYSLYGHRYSINYPISFTQNAGDSDDLLNLVWDFANGTGSQVTFSAYSLLDKLLKGTNFGDINKSYSESGVYNVKLYANEARRSLSTVSNTKIVAFKEGINIVPVVSSPLKGQSYFSDIVLFNASETYVANCVTCISGCSGERVNGFYTIDGGLNCTYIHAPNSYSSSLYRGKNLTGYKLKFEWLLDDGRTISGYWTKENYWNSVEFVYRFKIYGDHLTKLTVTYEL